MPNPISLKEALKNNLLEDFIAQSEAEGVKAADEEQFTAAIATMVRRPRSEGRTSRSPSRDGSAET